MWFVSALRCRIIYVCVDNNHQVVCICCAHATHAQIQNELGDLRCTVQTTKTTMTLLIPQNRNELSRHQLKQVREKPVQHPKR